MPDTRILLLSAYTSNSTMVAAQSRNLKRPLRMLNKPCRPDDLLRATEAVLKSA